MVDISIIVPVYNVEKYLIRCLDSIYNQNFSGFFEVIAINDCSTDNSLNILKEYSNRYKNITIVNQEINKSLAFARATGIKIAKGDYVLHVDSDDWVLSGMFENLYKNALDSNADIIVFEYQKDNGKGKSNFIKQISDKKLINYENKLDVQKYFFGACWNKMVKKELLEDLVYGGVYMNTTEDLIYSTEILIKAKSILLVPETYYVYFTNENSLTSLVTTKQYLKSQIIIYSELEKLSNKYKDFRSYYKGISDNKDTILFIEFLRNHLENKLDINDFELFFRQYIIIQLDKVKSSAIEKSYYNFNFCFINLMSSIGFNSALKILIIITISKLKALFKIKR